MTKIKDITLRLTRMERDALRAIVLDYYLNCVEGRDTVREWNDPAYDDLVTIDDLLVLLSR